MMQERWVFGYGSLMWRPGFDFVERRQALLRGLHRRLCIFSHVHRGTPELPGLVMGLDRGGACHGIAYRVVEVDWEGTLAYLREREQATKVYVETVRPIQLIADPTNRAPSRPVQALIYMADHKHPQYAGRLGVDEQIVFVRQGQGISGHCADYVSSAVGHLRKMGLSDPLLETLAKRLNQA